MPRALATLVEAGRRCEARNDWLIALKSQESYSWLEDAANCRSWTRIPLLRVGSFAPHLTRTISACQLATQHIYSPTSLLPCIPLYHHPRSDLIPIFRHLPNHLIKYPPSAKEHPPTSTTHYPHHQVIGEPSGPHPRTRYPNQPAALSDPAHAHVKTRPPTQGRRTCVIAPATSGLESHAVEAMSRNDCGCSRRPPQA
ncbi:hypothetical protein K458DRAFT_133088 [Lentithecium fluviatile CBS 122367]|uniref:Uncharacterized protein n=1 Tax=Lentithecium fluviatile CBS 122367 TaxID=1168545 RepID=A0A6G1ILT4_9PLEO|nr:hypothetical protein K458DRAFT_133088 [Lentithecium fluviatile CBS 122367]